MEILVGESKAVKEGNDDAVGRARRIRVCDSPGYG
jgi:hypothetical protein